MHGIGDSALASRSPSRRRTLPRRRKTGTLACSRRRRAVRLSTRRASLRGVSAVRWPPGSSRPKTGFVGCPSTAVGQGARRTGSLPAAGDRRCRRTDGAHIFTSLGGAGSSGIEDPQPEVAGYSGARSSSLRVFSTTIKKGAGSDRPRQRRSLVIAVSGGANSGARCGYIPGRWPVVVPGDHNPVTA